jgi:hypothetical protein
MNNGYQEEMSIGGYQPKTISGTSPVPLVKCYAIIPDQNGCVISNLKRSDNLSINWADSAHLNLAGNDISGHRAPIVCNPDYHWVEITLASGKAQAGRIGKV